jgi:T5SS/PEP-CTERM-associated repeat protein
MPCAEGEPICPHVNTRLPIIQLASNTDNRMTRLRRSLLVLAMAPALCLIGQSPLSHAAIKTSGNVEPINSATWTDSTTVYVGNTAEGSLTVDLGSGVFSSSSYLGYAIGSSGSATVSGAGSTWTNSGSLYVGYRGSGTLTVDDGGLVIAQSLYASLRDLSGNGTIRVRGAVLDTDLVFDATHGLDQTLAFGTGGALSLNVDGTGWLGAGHKDSGSLRIAEAATVTAAGGLIGIRAGSVGTATVIGAGSAWTINSNLSVGSSGSGTLNIVDGGQVSNTIGYIGRDTGSTGFASISGTGSTWTNSGSLSVGRAGNGTLSIMDGGRVGNNSGSVGYSAGSTGVASISGAGSAWTTNLALIVGNSGSGTLRVADGGEVNNTYGYLGFETGSTGTATVSGAASRWISSAELHVGEYGDGTLLCDAGALVSSTRGSLGHWIGSSGTATVSGAGSKWTNSGDLNVGLRGEGTLNIAAGGEVSNTIGYLADRSSGTATVTGAGSKWSNSSDLHVGWGNDGTLTIEAGGEVSSNVGYLGFKPDSSGTATVSGPGSKWSSSTGLCVGLYGKGTLNIEAGGEVSSSSGSVGYHAGATGVASIRGAGSTWTNSSALQVGNSGKGMLTLADGGAVTASAVSINSQSLLAIDVANGSRLTVDNGTGTITNNGTVRLLAGARANPGEAYTPISAGVYDGSGGYQGVGGVWSMTSRTFTPSTIETGTAGTPVSLNLADQQRVKISDSTTGWALGASFLAKSAALTVTTSAISDATRTNLEAIIAPDASLLSGWQFTTDGGYASGEPVYLSFDVGADYSRPDFSVWRLSGTNWASYDAVDLTYDGRYASFTVTDLSGYAVSAVPEPTTVAMLFAAVLAGAAWRFRAAMRLIPAIRRSRPQQSVAVCSVHRHHRSARPRSGKPWSRSLSTPSDRAAKLAGLIDLLCRSC